MAVEGEYLNFAKKATQLMTSDMEGGHSLGRLYWYLNFSNVETAFWYKLAVLRATEFWHNVYFFSKRFQNCKGTSTGYLSAFGANSLNFWKLPRGNASAIKLFFEPIWLELMLKLLISVWYTMNLNHFKTLSDFDVLEFKMQTTAMLSTWKLIFFLWNKFPHNITARAIGIISK